MSSEEIILLSSTSILEALFMKHSKRDLMMRQPLDFVRWSKMKQIQLFSHRIASTEATEASIDAFVISRRAILLSWRV